MLESGRRRGQTCGRTVKGFIAPGVGRCQFHMSARERAIALAVLDAVRDLRELRALPRERSGDEHQEDAQPGREPDADAGFEWPGDGWTEVTDDVPIRR